MYIVVTHTEYQNAAVHRGKLPYEIWLKFIECWPIGYTQHPTTISLDQEYGLTTLAFISLSTALETNLQYSGAQSHNSIGIAEIYHLPLQRVLRTLRAKYKKDEQELLLRYAVKGLSDTMGPNRLVPSLLVSRTLPKLSMIKKLPPSQKELMDMSRLASDEVAKIWAEQRILMALKSIIPPSARFKIRSGHSVSAYSEKERGRFPNLTVLDVDGKLIWINTRARIVRLNLLRVRTSLTNNDEKEVVTIMKSMEQFKSNSYNEISVVEVISDDNPSSWNKELINAKKKEINGLIRK